jgi:hypothetical protein
MSKYWYFWSLIAGLSVIFMLWLAHNTGNDWFIALATIQALLALICAVLGKKPPPPP